MESHGLLHARLRASLAGADRGLEFASAHQLDPLSAEQIPANLIGWFLDAGDLRKLHQMLIKKKPPAPSVRRPTASRQLANHDPPQGRRIATALFFHIDNGIDIQVGADRKRR
jgi:hypothetical protein